MLLLELERRQVVQAAMRSDGVEVKPQASMMRAKEDADASIAVARVLRRQGAHGCNHRCVLRRHGQPVAEGVGVAIADDAERALGDSRCQLMVALPTALGGDQACGALGLVPED